MSSTGQVDDQDRLLSYGSATYQYDNHGTLTNKSDGGQSTAYRYDARGSLLGVQYGTNEISYTVDALGRRISRTKNGTTTQRFVYQGFLSPVAELNADGSVATHFVYATRANVPDYMVRSNITYRLIADIRGSVRLVVNTDTGAIAQRLDYDEYGNVTFDSSPGFQPFSFAGGLYDPDTGLVRFGFRDYDPETGRWIAKDPILFGGGQANLYLYCGSDPINFRDCDGRLTNDLSESQLNGVVNITYNKLKNNPGPQSTFDTSFWDGYDIDIYWNYKGKTYRGDDINYLGIGMYDASKGNALWWSKMKTYIWKLQYPDIPSDDVIKWLEYGYNKYEVIEKKNITNGK